jgi:hypothetical protein
MTTMPTRPPADRACNTRRWLLLSWAVLLGLSSVQARDLPFFDLKASSLGRRMDLPPTPAPGGSADDQLTMEAADFRLVTYLKKPMPLTGWDMAVRKVRPVR